LPLLFAAFLGGSLMLASCEKEESGVNTQQSADISVQLKAFHQAMKTAGSSIVRGESKEAASVRRASIMINDARALIYATGVSQEEVSKLYPSDRDVIKHAMDIYIEQNQNK
jgi:hypothetical protein